jgi:DNA-binding MarR family transcriptional regulator
METLVNRFVEYIKETLGTSVLIQEWSHTEELPLYLRERYAFFQMEILSVPSLLVVHTGMGEQTPAVIEKHLKQLTAKTDEMLVYLRDAISSYDRKRLIERKIPFVVPGNQMYMPFLGVDLREHFRGIRRKSEPLSPATQFLLMYLLQQTEDVEMNPSKAAELLGYSRMTMTRAFQELENIGIGEHKKIGKGKYLYLGESKRNIWEAALPYLQNPVQRRIFLRRLNDYDTNQYKYKLAGQSALAKITMIAEPRVPIYAIQGKHWKGKNLQGYQELPYPDYDAVELELWSYPVQMAEKVDTVDRLSLYLSLIDSADERVQGALNNILEGILW